MMTESLERCGSYPELEHHGLRSAGPHHEVIEFRFEEEYLSPIDEISDVL